MVNSSMIRRIANRIFIAGLLGGFFFWDLAHALGGIPALKIMVTGLPPLALIFLGAIQTWVLGFSREELVQSYRSLAKPADNHPPTITAWESLLPAEMEEVVHTLAAKIREGKLYALNISILPGRNGAMLLSGIINEGQGVQAITQLTQQGTTDPSGSLSPANFKGDRE